MKNKMIGRKRSVGTQEKNEDTFIFKSDSILIIASLYYKVPIILLFLL